jgi:hypothetical protein
LLSGVVNGVGLGENDLRDGDEGVPVLEELFDDAGQGFGSVKASNSEPLSAVMALKTSPKYSPNSV